MNRGTPRLAAARRRADARVYTEAGRARLIRPVFLSLVSLGFYKKSAGAAAGLVADYNAMDRLMKEERNYILGMVKKIKASGCNVLLIQKSILRDATTELSLHYLAKAKILVVRDVERDEIEFISKTLNCLPIAHIDHMKPEKLGHADLVEEVSVGSSKLVKVRNTALSIVVSVIRGGVRRLLQARQGAEYYSFDIRKCTTLLFEEVSVGSSKLVKVRNTTLSIV
eukprot:45220-Prorocentrum_minimum.AAC.1